MLNITSNIKKIYKKKQKKTVYNILQEPLMNIHLYTNVIKKSVLLLIIPNTKSRYSNNTHGFHVYYGLPSREISLTISSLFSHLDTIHKRDRQTNGQTLVDSKDVKTALTHRRRRRRRF